MRYKKYYSTKRKPDYITFFGFLLFAVLIAFQVFVTMIAPQLVRRHNALSLAREREEMFQDIDMLRAEANSVSVKSSDIASIEKNLLIANLNDMALYIRNNHLAMSAEQVSEMHERILKNRMIVERWRGNKTAPFHLKREQPNIAPYLDSLEKSILQAESEPKK